MGRLASRRIESLVQKDKSNKNSKIEGETKNEQQFKKKEFRKKSGRDKDYDTDQEKEFTSALYDIQLKVNYMDGDGNCLFRSIADQLTGKCSNHHEIRMMVVDYIEVRKDHFSLFMEDDESFENYVDRMKTFGEWGGHQELYAASQCLHINIIVHQCSRTAPRFILPCETATRSINLSYHGECHYNSVHHLVNKLVYQEFSEMKKSISCIISSVSNKPNLAQVKEVLRALPWTSSTSQVEQALKISGNNVDAAVELLILNPDWHNDDAEDQGSIDHCSGTAANGSNISKSSRPIPHMSFNSNNNNNVKGDGKDSFNEEPLNKCEQFPNSAPKIKFIRGKERLHNKLSIVDTKLSRKDQRIGKKDSKKILTSVTDASHSRNITPVTIGLGGIRDVFL